MDARLEAKLIECLSALESGEPLEQVLSRYPEDAAQLRPMLAVAAALPMMSMEPSQAAKSTSRRTFLTQAAALRGGTEARRLGFFARPLTAIASLALFVIVGVAVATSTSALPGDPLYGVKRLVENARLLYASDPAALAAQFEQERIREIAELLDAGREAEVEFSGIIESIQSDAWVVAGLPVSVDDNTRIEGDPQVGRRAQVRGQTMDGLLRATSIVVERGEEPIPAPTPTSEAEGTATPTPPPQRTPTPEVTPTPTPGQSPIPTRTPAPTTTPAPSEVRFTGVVASANAQTWTISGLVVEVNVATEFLHNPGLGSRAEVRALSFPDGRLVALHIERLDDGGDGNGNQNGNENQNENDNGNENENGNDNQNENSSGHGNGNDNGNDNSNDTK